MIESPFGLLFWTAVIVAGLFAVRSFLVGARTLAQTPPGPQGLPLFGNAFQVPAKHFGLYLKRLHGLHGGLVYLNINGMNIYSIGTQELATEILEKRSIIYSSRPAQPYFTRYIDPSGLIWAMNRPGENHYWGRRISSAIMKSVREGHTEAIQRFEALATLQNLLDDGGQSWYHQIQRQSASVVISAMLGVGSFEGNTPEVEKVVSLVENLGSSANLDASIINFFPLVDDLVPAWVPTPWRRKAATSVEKDRNGWDDLLDLALKGKGASMGTWTARFANEKTAGGDRRYLVTQFAAAAIETTTTALQSFVLACIVYPEWITHAQAELDRVVGKDRLPTYDDRPMLPYMEATLREVLRWNAPLHAGVPHENTADDVIEYKGSKYFIPKGSIIYYAAHAIEHDQSRFAEPQVFRPERFLDTHGNLKDDYHTSVFGFGRRACVGIPFAERSIWITISLILWAFNVLKTVDPDATGKTSYPHDFREEALKGGITNGPPEFPVRFELRDQRRALVARAEWEDCEKDLAALLPPVNAETTYEEENQD